MANTPANDNFSFRALHGREVILSDAGEVNETNIVQVLEAALPIHQRNRNDCEYLYKYYLGNQPIINRVKTVRPEIKNIVVENRANQIVNFKVGYCFGEPIQYVTTDADEATTNSIAMLNSYVASEDKETKDNLLAMWNHICGTSYRLVLPDDMFDEDGDEAPFEIDTLDPRDTFVVYQNRPGRKPLLGVIHIRVADTDVAGAYNDLYCCYTRNAYYEILGSGAIAKIVRSEPHYLGDVPIVEYPLNHERMGCFEVVVPLLDAINKTASDRQDGLEQFVQALLVFYNVDMDGDQYDEMRQRGAVLLKDTDPQFKANAQYLINTLDQSNTQTLVDHEYQAVLEIVGMPNRNGGSSTSDTGTATIVRDGWSDAESRAKNTEAMFKASEKRMLKMMLRICKNLANVSLKLGDIKIQFTRRNYENITQKSTVLTQMLGSDKIHPKLAFEHCGMFVDPERAYLESVEYNANVAKEGADEQTDTESSDSGSTQDDTVRS